MEVEGHPLARPALPDPCLLRLSSVWDPLFVNCLSEPNIGNGCGILAKDMNSRVDNADIVRTPHRSTIVKVELVKLKPLHEISKSFRLKSGQLIVSGEIPGVDSLQQLLCR